MVINLLDHGLSIFMILKYDAISYEMVFQKKLKQTLTEPISLKVLKLILNHTYNIMKL